MNYSNTRDVAAERCSDVKSQSPFFLSVVCTLLEIQIIHQKIGRKKFNPKKDNDLNNPGPGTQDGLKKHFKGL